ncbi:hypothetical protein AHIS1636_26630 [Arthrobacter mangrovi]|uniref:Uncharacterized protein n=2 Tax=Arthrobacter mangrovi TaxID=2966350 RepID=A0ABQ5MW49_9MICC|nr:hypothetical protein AHIS1636_26630 [Arthrobacter mangrovi]
MAEQAVPRIDAFMSVQALCADRSHDPSPALLRDSYAATVRFCCGFRHLQAAPAPPPNEATVYMPRYAQVAEACTFAALAEGYRAALQDGAAGTDEDLLGAVRRLADLVAADLATARQNYIRYLSSELGWWLERLQWVLDQAGAGLEAGGARAAAR